MVWYSDGNPKTGQRVQFSDAVWKPNHLTIRHISMTWLLGKSGIQILAEIRLNFFCCSKPLELLQIEIWTEEKLENAWLENVEEGLFLFEFPYLRYIDLHSAHVVVVAVVVQVVEVAVVLEVVVMKHSLTFWATSYRGLVAKTESIKTRLAKF